MRELLLKLKFTGKVVKILKFVVEILGKIFFLLPNYIRQPRKLPPISNSLLLESASSLAAKIRNKEITSEEVVKSFIARIEEINPILNAVVDQRFVEAIEEAKKIDSMLRNGDFDAENIVKSKPLLGVPFTAKESFQVKGLHQTAGLWARRNIVEEETAKTIQLLINAGGIMLCVTNVPELCLWWECNNYVYGRTNNAYDSRRTSGGSSGGEASNLSACGSVIGIGSDIAGSIRIPSFFNGIFGHKPSSGIVDTSGQQPIVVGELTKFLTVGPMCRFACDLMPMYKILAASNSNLLRLDEKVSMKNLKIYYMEESGDDVFNSTIDPELSEGVIKTVNYFKNTYGIEAKKLHGFGRGFYEE